VSRLPPKFGAADLWPWDRDYAATVFVSHLSDSKRILFGWGKPLLIVHGQDDWLTPAQAATYSAQLVPQAKLVMLPGGHDGVFEEQAKVGAEVGGLGTAPPAGVV